MARTALSISTGFYESASLALSAQNCKNLYPVPLEVENTTVLSLFNTPGLSQVATASTLSTFACRGAHELDGTAYFVLGPNLYRLNSDYSLENMGAIDGVGRVSMADNGTQLMILSPGGNGYIFTEDPDTLAQITDVDFTTTNGAPQYVVFIDSYFLVTTDQGKFIISALNNGLSWSALDVGTAEADPDAIVAPAVLNNQLYIGGSQTFEQFNNRGGADFPFQRSGLYMDKGVFAPFSIVNSNKTFYWIGGGENETPAVYRINGNQPEKVSSIAVDQALTEYTDAQISAAFAMAYSEDGAFFVEFVLPDRAFVYEAVTGQWHERTSRVTAPGAGAAVETTHRAVTALKAYGVVLAGDTQDGRIGVMSNDTYEEYGEERICEATGQPFANLGKSMALPYLELDMESGVGNAAAEDPQVSLYLSRDGKTWSDPIPRRIGKQGEFDVRQIWTRLGKINKKFFLRLRVTAPVKVVLNNYWVDIRGMVK